jgi:AAA family ATP:ADP antiporter
MIPSLLAIKKGEWSKTFLMFLYFFLVITAYYIIKPVRDSLFIEHLGAQNLPFVYLSDAVIVGIVVFFYSRFTISMESHRLSAISIGILISNLLVFRWIHTFHWAWVSFIFYIWVGIFSILTVTQFWTCANDIFDPREAKRLFGLMGSGGILGGITGGLITSKITQYVGTENLMLVSAGVLALCILVLNAVWSIASQQAAWKDQIKLEESNPNPGEGVSLKTFSLIKASRYLMLMVVLVFLMKAVSTLVDYQF